MPGEYKIQKLPVIMSDIPCFAETKSFPQVRGHPEPEIIQARVIGHITLVKMLVHLNDRRDRSLNGSFGSKEIKKGVR